MASGIARGRVCTTAATVELRKMAAIKLESTICKTLGNKLSLLDVTNAKSVRRMSQISQTSLSTKILILYKFAYYKVLHFLWAKY